MINLVETIINEKSAKEFIEDNFKNQLDKLKELRGELIRLIFRRYYCLY